MNWGVCGDIEYDDVVAAIDNMKLEKAAGIDEVVLEFIKFRGEPVTRALRRLFGIVWKNNKMLAE